MFAHLPNVTPFMPSNLASVALLAMRDNIELAKRFVSGMSPEQFSGDIRTLYAVMRAPEIISEASRRLPNDVLERHPDLPWRAIRDVGNFYRHQYDHVAETYVWRTVEEHLGPLHEAVVAELSRLDLKE
jgi:uncharacterized protein with HEPN domain